MAAKSKSFLLVWNSNLTLSSLTFFGFVAVDVVDEGEDVLLTSVSIAMVVSLESSVEVVVMVGIFGAKTMVVRRGLRSSYGEFSTS